MPQSDDDLEDAIDANPDFARRPGTGRPECKWETFPETPHFQWCDVCLSMRRVGTDFHWEVVDEPRSN